MVGPWLAIRSDPRSRTDIHEVKTLLIISKRWRDVSSMAKKIQ